MSERRVARSLTLELDERQWSWLREIGAPAETMRALLDRAIREDIVKRALRDEHAVELLIRRQHRQLKLRFGGTPGASREGVSLRAVAEDEILASCESMQDATMRAAAARLRLRLQSQRGQSGDPVEARAALQRLREQRPGGWRELLSEWPA